MNLLNYSNDFFEDIEISIYDNFKEENKYGDFNVLIIREMINDLIIDIESAKGFIALLRQSYLLGKLRSNLVSIHLIFNFFLSYRKMNLLLVYLVKRK